MPEPDRNVEYRGTGFYVGLLAILVFAIALLVIAVQNTQEVDVDFFGFAFSVPLFAVAIGAALLAIVLDELIGLVWRRQRRLRLAERAELERLRATEAQPEEEEEVRIEAEPGTVGPDAEQPAAKEEDRSTEAPGGMAGDQEEERVGEEGEESNPERPT